MNSLHRLQHGPRALALLSDLPYPPRNGNHQRYLQQLRLLAGMGFEVLVVAGVMRSDEGNAGPIGQLESTLSIPPLKLTPTARLERMAVFTAAALGVRVADPVGYAHRRAGFDRFALAEIRRLKPDVVLMRSYFSNIAQEVAQTGAATIMDIHDASALLTLMLMRQNRGLAKLGLAPYVAAARRSDATMRIADELWVTSQREVEYFGRRLPDTHQVLVPNGVEVPSLPAPVEHTHEMVQIGDYRWPPNLLAAETLVEQILPRVREHIPDASVTLISGHLPADHQARWRDLPVNYLGVVDDVLPFLRRAGAMVFAPPTSARSPLNLKVAEALALGTPVAVTQAPVYWSGLRNGIEAVVCDDYDELAEGIIALMQNSQRRQELRQGAHAWANANLSTESLLGQLHQESILSPERWTERGIEHTTPTSR